MTLCVCVSSMSMGASECECVRDLDTVKTAIYQRAHEISAVFLPLFFFAHTRTHRLTKAPCMSIKIRQIP